jgi:hypothetical protein
MRRNLMLSMVVVGLLFGFAADARAAGWTAGGADDRWDNAANWNPGVPGIGDFATFTNATANPNDPPHVALIDSANVGGNVAESARVILGDNDTEDDSTVNQTGGTFNIATQFDVGFIGKGTYNLTGGTATVTTRLGIGGGNSGGKPHGIVTVNGGALSADNITLGTSHDGSTTFQHQLNLISGSVDANVMYLGDESATDSRIDMTGGTMTVGDLGIITASGISGTAIGHFQLDDGILNVTNATPATQGEGGVATGFRIINSGTLLGSMDITGSGKMVLAGAEADVATALAVYTGAGTLTGNGSGGNVNVFFNSGTGFTEVTAIPEPGTLTLAALGLLSLVGMGRRRRDRR